MITVADLSKRFGRTVAVDHLSFQVRPGTVTGFLGPNGSGKSTTMRCMLGLDRPDTGGASFGNRSYRQLSSPLHEVGALLDAGYVHPGRSGRNHLRWLAASNGLAKSRVDEVLTLVGLDTVGGRRVKTYSLGMRQRLGLAGVLLGDPHTVVLDEPANGLDPEGIRWIRDVLVHLASQGRTVLVSSHLLSEMAQMANDLVVIGQGRLIEQCTVEQFVARHADRWVRVSSPGVDAITRAVIAQGAKASMVDATTAELRGVTAAEVGELAARDGIVLHELSPQTGSLEDAFLQATAAAQQFASQPVGGSAMINTLRSEWIKLRTVRMNLVLFIIAVAFPVIVCVLVASLGDITDLKVADVAGLVAGSSVITALLLGVVGAVSISSEFAYGTIRPTFAATPRRMRVLGSKALVIALFALVAEALVVVICYVLSSAIATSRGATLSLSDDAQARSALIGIVVFAIIVSLLGFGLGMVIRNTPAAVAILILWPLVAENIIFLILTAAGVNRPRRFLPYTSGFGLASTDVTSHEGLSRIAGGVYFAVVTAAVAAAGAFITSRRDA